MGVSMPRGIYDHSKQRADLLGAVFGRLTVVEFHHSDNGTHWLCRCDCGSTCVVTTSALRRGHTQSCGCHNRDRSSATHSGARKGNLFRIDGNIVYVRLSNCDDEFTCDADDLGLVLRETWRKSDTGYATYGKSKTFHNALLSPPSGFVVDHINRNKLDNRRCNLRVVPQSTNVQNAGGTPRGASGVRGVFRRPNGRFVAQITFCGKRIRIGTFNTLDDAITARKNKEIELNFGGLHNGNLSNLGAAGERQDRGGDGSQEGKNPTALL